MKTAENILLGINGEIVEIEGDILVFEDVRLFGVKGAEVNDVVELFEGEKVASVLNAGASVFSFFLKLGLNSTINNVST